MVNSLSLYTIGDDAGVIYIRYSKVHSTGRTFFGLRETDLRQLEGRNAFICFILDDSSPPLFVPYSAFEEVFHSATSADDGQYKVQLIAEKDGLKLYIARQGRFNVEGYVGFDGVRRSLAARRFQACHELTHSQVQAYLATIGHLKGYDVWVPANNATALDQAPNQSRVPLRLGIPAGYDEIKAILSEIDVVWVKSGANTIEGLFEVEHSTPIYSGLLRFNDVLLTNDKIRRFSIVSNDTRRAAFSRQAHRPTFRQSGLAELVSFLEYANVLDWYDRLAKGGTNG